MDSFIYTLVLSPALTELLPKSVGASVNFLIGAMVRHAGTIGKPVAYTAIDFGLGLLIIPFAQETRNEPLPD